LDFTHYYGKHKRENVVARQIDGRQKNRVTIRLDDELNNKVNNLAKELVQTESKVIRDILNNFFLDREIIENKKDVEHFLYEKL